MINVKSSCREYSAFPVFMKIPRISITRCTYYTFSSFSSLPRGFHRNHTAHWILVFDRWATTTTWKYGKLVLETWKSPESCEPMGTVLQNINHSSASALYELLNSTIMPINLFSNHRYCRILCAGVCLCVLMGLFKSCPIYIAMPHYPYCLHYCPEVRCSFPHWGLSSRWPNMPQDGRQAGRHAGREWAVRSVFIVLGPPYANWCTGPRVVPDCSMLPGEQAADLIFQHTAAPTSGPGEGDLPCLLECLFNWNCNQCCAFK